MEDSELIITFQGKKPKDRKADRIFSLAIS